MSRKPSVRERHRKLTMLVEESPMLTDEEIAAKLGVSVQTVRLDRMKLAIPELRERVRQLAEKSQGRLRSMSGGDVVGELVDLQLNRCGVSVLQLSAGMGFSTNDVVRGHHLFAQANSLAVAIIDADRVVTGSARIRFPESAKVGESVVAKARVTRSRGNKYLVDVESRVGTKPVLIGRFIVVANPREDLSGRTDWQ